MLALVVVLQRLPWFGRELRRGCILTSLHYLHNDTRLAVCFPVLCSFVMGLLVAYGLEPFSAAELEGGSSSHAQQAQQAQQAARQAAVTARQRAAAMVAAAGGSSRTGGQDGPSGSEAGSAAVLSRNPVEALQPFLYEHSEHFW